MKDWEMITLLCLVLSVVIGILCAAEWINSVLWQ